MRSFVVMVALVLSVIVGAEDRAVPGKTEIRQVGGVSVSVTPLNLAAGGAETVDFQVVMETHQGALPTDMLGAAKLVADRGEEIPASAWSGGGGGHHLSGKFSFPAGKLGNFKTLTLLLKGIGGQVARFEWKIPVNAAVSPSTGAG